MSDYKKTLHLPKTKFPMKANLTQKEPEMLKNWEKGEVYKKMTALPAPKGDFVLHDGPPYANGNIHLGTALNKILKDIIVKSRNMQGYHAEYVPGWDCHGLPIEFKVEKELEEKKKDLPPHAVRRACRNYALKYLDIQRKEFKRLGVLGEWDNPYMTMRPEYEAATAAELGKFMENGSLVRSKKPVHWCTSCSTALAEAEVEHGDHTSPSIYVRFPLSDSKLTGVFPQADPARTFIVIWTTTPWTIPNNMGVAVHPDFDYSLVSVDGDFYVLAKELVESSAKKFGWESFEILATVKGEALERLVAKHPIYDRDSLVVLADYVTLESGTGCVHTAPGHGREDYLTGLKYGLDVYSPLRDDGTYTDAVEFFSGMSVFEANPHVIEKLEELGNLLYAGKVTHSYPHCWRCKKPVIFRATTQWFISMEKNDLRKKSLDAIDNKVQWIPAWGRERIHNMVEFRPDWCISRQRLWGVPIIALLCTECEHAFHDKEWIDRVVGEFAKFETGCDWWFITPVEDLVPEGLKCPVCGSIHWKKETDILDVWFDSGTSFAAVVEQRPECSFPADLYLEGSDQHRGWFHSSLLASMGTRGVAPYRSVLTHGYVVDGDGKKMSKSIGNVVAPQEIIDKYGAEILRMWVASVDYQEDVRISEEILSRLVDAYRRIRNTCRYILGNLSDFTSDSAVAFEDMLPLDRYAVDMASRSHERIQQAYENYEFHKVFHTLHNLCVTDLSAFYLDIIKDRLYASGTDSIERRSAQTALAHILELLVKDMAPVMSFTAEEVFSHIPEGVKPEGETVFALRDAADLPTISEEESRRWTLMTQVRSEVTKAIEPKRKSGEIGHSLDTKVTVYADDALRGDLEALIPDAAQMREIFIVSQLEIAGMADAPADAVECEEVNGLKVAVSRAGGEKCERCWIYSEELGTNPEHPTACPRCTSVLTS